MQRIVTFLALGLLVAGAAAAQPNRVGQDVIWARDIGSNTITVDGTLDEAVWQQAEVYHFMWNDPNFPLPGGGQALREDLGGLGEPTDPPDGMFYVLRKGNELYIGFHANDASIGGRSDFFQGDGLMMTLVNKSDRPETFTDLDDYFESTRVREEMFYGWQHYGPDTTATGAQVPGIAPKAWSTDFGFTAGDSSTATPRNPEAWEFAATVDGVSNDDYNGTASFVADNGYTMEMRIRLDSLGWDLTQAMARMPLTIAMMDRDYGWPNDASRASRAWLWWQGRWLNNFNEGAVYIAADPSVTVTSGDAPAYMEPEFTVPNGETGPAPTIDGSLDEALWMNMEPQFKLKYQATADELDAGLPGALAPTYTFYYHGDGNTVLDPTEGRFKMFYRGSTLYVGLDNDDQAVNGIEGEGLRDGFRITIASMDSLKSGLAYSHAGIQLDFSIDSTGAIRYGNYANTLVMNDPTAIQGAVGMKTGSTVADPSDIDQGYQMEVAIDLAAFGYDAAMEDGQIWIALNYFDGDSLDPDNLSYGTRTWVIGERENGASLYGYLDPASIIRTANEGGPDTGETLRALGTAPNPATGMTAVRYELARDAQVTVEVYDVLGRRVQMIEAGVQTAGLQTARVDASALAAGAYVYRVRTADGASVSGQMLVVR